MKELLETIKLAGLMVFAIPPALAGIHFLLAGRLLIGGTLIGLAVGLVAVKRWLTMPGDVPGLVLGKLVGSSGTDAEGEDR